MRSEIKLSRNKQSIFSSNRIPFFIVKVGNKQIIKIPFDNKIVQFEIIYKKSRL